jgi:hypothetical protein
MPIVFNQPIAFLTSIMGTYTNTAQARLTSIMGITTSRKAARLTSIGGFTDAVTSAHLTHLSGVVSATANAPILAPGPAQTVGPGARVQLTASALPLTGSTLATWEWRVIDKSTPFGIPVLNDETTGNPWFYAPMTSTEATYTFGVKVTDSMGRTSGEGTVVISVDRPTVFLPSPTGWNAPVAELLPTADGWA